MSKLLSGLVAGLAGLFVSAAAYAVTGNGTGSAVAVTGNGTGSAVAVTGNGTGVQAEVYLTDACFTGSYGDADNAGQGINVEVQDDGRILAYLYLRSGTWAFFVGQPDDMIGYQAVAYDGEVVKVGTASFSTLDDNTVVLSYRMSLSLGDWDGEGLPWCLRGDCQADMVAVRFTQPIDCGSSTQVTGNGTGKQVTGTGTGTGKQVTGTGTGKQVTGNGTGSQ